MSSLATVSLNAMFDETASVLAAKENRHPDAILLYMFVLVVLAGVVIAYRSASPISHRAR